VSTPGMPGRNGAATPETGMPGRRADRPAGEPAAAPGRKTEGTEVADGTCPPQEAAVDVSFVMGTLEATGDGTDGGVWIGSHKPGAAAAEGDAAPGFVGIARDGPGVACSNRCTELANMTGITSFARVAVCLGIAADVGRLSAC
jgi:hypothetical protein